MRRSPASEAYDTFAILDGWREKLITFIEQESGTFLGEDKQWVSNFYDFENYHQKLAASTENLQNQLSDFQLQNEPSLRQSQEIWTSIKKDKEEMSMQTG